MIALVILGALVGTIAVVTIANKFPLTIDGDDY